MDSKLSDLTQDLRQETTCLSLFIVCICVLSIDSEK